MEKLKEWIVWAVLKFFEILHDLSQWMLQRVWDLVPDVPWMASVEQTFSVYWAVVDAWVPASEALAMYASLLTFRTGLIAVRWFLKVVRGA